MRPSAATRSFCFDGAGDGHWDGLSHSGHHHQPDRQTIPAQSDSSHRFQLIYAEYQSSSQRINNGVADPLTIDDLTAVRAAVPSIVAASPAIDLSDRIPVAGGKERDIHILGVSPEYRIVRNLVIVSGTFFDLQDQQSHNKVAVIVDKLANTLYGSPEDAIGKVVKVSGLPFTIVGTFRERVDTFGQSEVTDNTLLMPFTVARYFIDVPVVKQLHFSVADSSMVVPVTEQIKRVLQSRHRPESVYSVDNLTQLVSLADKVTNMMTLVLALISLVVLLVSGIGIMNIMLSTVSARIREIGIRKAIGATNREIRFQFLSEAILISSVGWAGRSHSGPGHSILGTRVYGIPYSDLWAIGDFGDCGFVAGGNYFWYGSGYAGCQARSGGEFAVRVTLGMDFSSQFSVASSQF